MADIKSFRILCTEEYFDLFQQVVHIFNEEYNTDFYIDDFLHFEGSDYALICFPEFDPSKIFLLGQFMGHHFYNMLSDT